MRSRRASALFATIVLIGPVALRLAGLVVLGLATVGSSRAQTSPPGPPAEPSAVASPQPLLQPGHYVGIATCGTANCHGGTLPRNEQRILANEYFTWDKKDLHRRAYEVLLNPRSAAIARNLRLSAPPARTPLCLDCHALQVPTRLQEARLEIEDGISCESCHGPASGWLEGHRAEGWTHADSVAAGMRDTKDLGVRAGLCLSCHQGDAKRSVDHELIAAGHPVLAFELDNYARTMPPHWRARENGARAWAVGQAAAFASGLDRVGATARSGRWPEFSELSCSPCHHSLSEERWRSERPPGRPGQPRPSVARWTVLRHLARAYAPGELTALDEGVAELSLRTARLTTPSAEVAAAAEALRPRAANLARAVAGAEFGAAEIRRLLLEIAAGNRANPADIAEVAGAEQVLLALQTLSAELLAGRSGRGASGGLGAALDRLNAELEDRNRFDAGRFAERLRDFEERVRALR